MENLDRKDGQVEQFIMQRQSAERQAQDAAVAKK